MMKHSLEWWLNRLLIGGGVLIGGCTLFYSVTFYNMYADAKGGPVNSDETEQVTELAQQEEDDISMYVQFEDPFNDASITQEKKDLINKIPVNESASTSVSLLDNRVSSIYNSTSRIKKTAYEKMLVAYDYMLEKYKCGAVEGVDQKNMTTLCEGVSFVKEADMEVAYRANHVLEKNLGDCLDFAAAYTALLRKIGIEAYYVTNETEQTKVPYVTTSKRDDDDDDNKDETTDIKQDDTYKDIKGYVVVKIDNDFYVFDPASERLTLPEGSKAPEYKFFGLKQEDVESLYHAKDILRCIENYGGFATYPSMRLSVMISNKSYSITDAFSYTSGSEEANEHKTEGSLHVSVGDTIQFAGTVTTAPEGNTWKLEADLYDSDMEYKRTVQLVNGVTNSAYNESSYTTEETGYVKLRYSVTDAYKRTCTIVYLCRVYSDAASEETTKRVERATTSERETTEADVDDPFTGETTTAHEATTAEESSDELTTEPTSLEETTTQNQSTEEPEPQTTEKPTETEPQTTEIPTETEPQTTEAPTEESTEAPTEEPSQPVEE